MALLEIWLPQLGPTVVTLMLSWFTPELGGQRLLEGDGLVASQRLGLHLPAVQLAVDLLHDRAADAAVVDGGLHPGSGVAVDEGKVKTAPALEGRR